MEQALDNKHISLILTPTGSDSLTVRLIGRLDASSTGKVWHEAVNRVRDGLWKAIVIETDGLEYLDGAGIGLLVQLKSIQTDRGGRIEIRGLKPKFQRLLNMFDPSDITQTPVIPTDKIRLLEKVGLWAAGILSDMKGQVAFVGESCAAVASALVRPGTVRWKDVFLLSEKAGVNALPIICLIGFLMGLIMSFQSAITLKRFGAEIFVADMLGLVMFRELGPLVTAILLAGRSGSAFAAEIGTMKVNEEIDALTTMGLNPIRFLVVSRMLAALAVTPFLSLFFCFLSLIGGAVVMLTMGYPLTTYVSRVFLSLGYVDVIGGIFKAAVFSLFVAGIGCQEGLTTKTGASAVGDSTTSAVVNGIILIAVLDGIFAVIFYYLGI